MFDFKCVGLDIFVICNSIPRVPEHFGDFKLDSISQRGLKIWPGAAPKNLEGNWFCCRYFGEGITDDGIKKLLLEVEKYGVWEKIQKLWSDKNGKKLFSGSYES